jgi:hypothetical protein
LKKLTGSVRFYKQKTENRTELKQKKPSQTGKTEKNWKKMEPKPRKLS